MTAEIRPGSQDSFGPEQKSEDSKIVTDALADALSRIPEGNGYEARARINRGIRNRFAPAIMESETISDELKSTEYTEYVGEISEFLEGARLGAVECPDGRISPYLSIGDPGVIVVHQRLAGKPEVRPSSNQSGTERMVLNDPNITAGIVSSARKRREANDHIELVEFLGPHINSEDPTHGCGAMGLEIQKNEILTTGMRFGGIAQFHDSLGEGFYAFDNMARGIKDLQIPSTTFDLTHDIHTQGLITGIRNVYTEFDPNRTLRENLINLHRDRKIVMTEELDEVFHGRIHEIATQLYGDDHEIQNPLDPGTLADNIMKIGRIAKVITQEEEERGFDFIPDELTQDATPIARRALAYTLIRNVVYRRLADIRAGHHSLVKHNEEWIRVGSSGPLNIDHVPFVLRTPSKRLRDDDIDEVFALEGILRGALQLKGAKPQEEATIITVGATFNPGMYANEEIAQEQKDILFSTVGNEAARIRNKRPNDIKNGHRVVLGVLYGADKTITEIVR